MSSSYDWNWINFTRVKYIKVKPIFAKLTRQELTRQRKLRSNKDTTKLKPEWLAWSRSHSDKIFDGKGEKIKVDIEI